MLDTLSPPARDLTSLTGALAGAGTRAEVVSICRDIVDASPHVRLHRPGLDRLARLVAGADPVSWTWYTRPGASLADACFDLAAIAAPNGGYFDLAPDGAVRQWARAGSGAKALEAWMNELRESAAMPGVDLIDPHAVRDAIAPRLAGLPYADRRLQIAEEFACPRRRARFDALMQAARHLDGTWHLNLDLADHLAAIYPAGFAEDPFRKKAILTLTMLYGYLTHAGERVTIDTPLPADYQMPRIFHYTGCLHLAPMLQATLKAGDRLLDVESAEVVSMRAAAVVLAADLAVMTGEPEAVVDGALFVPFRNDPAFQRDSLPAMRCDTLWF